MIYKKKEIPIWGDLIPFNSSKSKYADMELSKAVKPMVMLNWFKWVFGKKLMKDNHGHDDYVDRMLIKKNRVKSTYEDVPTVAPYIIQNSKIAVVIAPGGGFCDLSIKDEGEMIAQMLNHQGISAFVLTYRLEPYRFPIPCLDMQRAIRWVRYYAKDLGIPAACVGAMGFSAGGYTAAGSAILLGNNPVRAEHYIKDSIDAENGMPDLVAPIYPVVSFDVNPNMLANLKGKEFYTNKVKRERWLKEYSLTEQLDRAAAVPQFLCYGTKDPLGGMAEYGEKLLRRPKQNQVCILEGASHGFANSKKWQRWENECIKWIKKTCS